MTKTVLWMIVVLTTALNAAASAPKVRGPSSVSGGSLHRRLYSASNVVSNSQDSYKYRVEVDEFAITITPALEDFTRTATIHEWLESTLFNELSVRTNDELVSFHLANIDEYKGGDGFSRYLEVTETSGLSGGTRAFYIAEGVAMLKDNSYSKAELNQMTQDIINENLLDSEFLPKEISYLSSTKYVSMASVNGEETGRASIGGVESGATASENVRNGKLVVAGAVCGLGVVVLSLGVALWTRQRGHERNGKEAMNDSIETVEADEDEIRGETGGDDMEVTSMETGRYVVQNMPPSLDDSEGSSDQGSTGSWTLSTFATHTRSILTTESFERDRQTTQLKKDMIGTTEWAAAYGDRSPPRVGPLKDTVLQASHFSSSDVAVAEDTPENSSPLKRSSTNKSSKEKMHTTPPFLFTSNGEEIYLMPPSQARSSRIVSYEPAEHPPPSPSLKKAQQKKRSALRAN